MKSIQEVKEEDRLLPWFRYHNNWPEPEWCEFVWLLAHSMLALRSACLVGDQAPVVKEMWKRMENPQIGDIVLETGTVWKADWPERALGRLVAKEKDPAGGHYWFVDPLYYHPRGESTTRWENCSFMALPINEERFLGKRGVVVFTRGSVMGELEHSGFELKR